MNNPIVELNVLEQTNILRIKSAFTKEQCLEITKQILDYKNNAPLELGTNQNANPGCWLGRPHFHGGFSPNIEQLLIDTFKESCDLYYQSMPKPANITRPNIDSIDANSLEVWAWANVNEPGAENREHMHNGGFISGVAYFQAENTGYIEFMPYNYTYKMTHQAWPYTGVSYYYPEDGDIILFPSFLLHKIERNPSDKQRVNMAFNATLPGVGGSAY
jgi:hypothetical protein